MFEGLGLHNHRLRGNASIVLTATDHSRIANFNLLQNRNPKPSATRSSAVAKSLKMIRNDTLSRACVSPY